MGIHISGGGAVSKCQKTAKAEDGALWPSRYKRSLLFSTVAHDLHAFTGGVDEVRAVYVRLRSHFSRRPVLLPVRCCTVILSSKLYIAAPLSVRVWCLLGPQVAVMTVHMHIRRHHGDDLFCRE